MHCPVTNALNGFVFASLLPSRFLCQGARDSSDSTILRMYHCNNCNVSTMSPKKLRSWPLNFGLQQHSVRNFFWDTLYVPSMCEIYKSFQVTPHCTEQTLCTVWRKSWPCFRKLPRRQHVDMHGLQLGIPIPDPVWSLHSCLGLRVWKTSDKTFCQHGHVSSGDHSGHVCHVVVSDTLVF